MSEQVADIGELEIAFEAFGDPADPVMLLITGLGMQMLAWDERLCEMLAGRGFRVVRFDNRDVGRSSWVEDGSRPDWGGLAAGDPASASYLLSDMAEDSVGLLDHLGADEAHVVAASLGGMIAQELAIRCPERVLSLSLMMTTTGNREVGQPHPEGLGALLSPPPPEREAIADWAVENWRAIGSPEHPMDEEAVRERARASFDRGYHPEGVGRQLAAVLASGDRTEKLAKLDMPTVVIHGEADVLIDVSGGRAVAAAIPGAKLITIPGMGHDLPRALWPRFVDEIAANTDRAAAPASRES